jgi:hypothetical protein
MEIYGAGFATIFLIFAAFYWRAARRASDPVARHEARLLVGHSFVFVFVAALSMGLAAFGGPRFGSLSGVSYGLIGPFQALYHTVARRLWPPPVAPSAAPASPVSRGSRGSATR